MRIRRISLPAAVLALALSSALALTAAPGALAAPGTPGVPQAPSPVFVEDFEGAGDGPTRLDAFDAGYTADAFWFDDAVCNGLWGSGQWPTTALNATCSTTRMEGMRLLIETVGGGDTTNHAAVFYSGAFGAGGQVQLRTPALTLVPGRWYQASAQVTASSCQGSTDPTLRWVLQDGATTTTLGAAQTPCAAQTPVLQTLTLASDVVRWTGSSAPRLALINEQGGGDGNDIALDDIAVVDLTPQLDMGFADAQVPVGTPTRLTFTVTNTTDLGAKPGLDVAAALPPGLVIDDDPQLTSDCPAAAFTVAAGSTAVTGTLDLGAVTSCTVSVRVVSDVAADYTLDPSAVTTILQAPAAAAVRFVAAAAAPETPTAATPTAATPAATLAATGVVTWPLAPLGALLLLSGLTLLRVRRLTQGQPPATSMTSALHGQ